MRQPGDLGQGHGLESRRVRDKTHLLCSSAFQSHPIQKRRKPTEGREKRDRKEKSLLPKKKLRIPYIIRTAKLYSRYSLFILHTSLGSWCPSPRRLKTASEKRNKPASKEILAEQRLRSGKKAKNRCQERNICGKQTKTSKSSLVWGLLA